MVPTIVAPEENVTVPVGTAGWVNVEEAMQFVIATLGKSPYLLGDKFSGADVLYATTFGMFGASPLLPKSPVIDAYVKRCLERPAYTRAQAKDAA